jgi:hypothetical protein
VSVAGGGGSDLRPGEKKLPAAQAGSRHARDAPWDRGRSQNRLAGLVSLRMPEHRFYRTGESDGPSWSGSSRKTYLGYFPTGSTAAGSSRMVACLLSFCASSCIAPDSAHEATRARWQASDATLSAAYSSDGSRENTSTMDGSRGALLPLAASFRLRATEARCGWSVMSRRRR